MSKWHSYHYNAVHYPKRLQPGNVFNPVYAGGSANYHADLYHNGHYHKGMYYNGELVWRRYDIVFHRGWKYKDAIYINVPLHDIINVLYADDTIKGDTFGLFTLLDGGDYDKIIDSCKSTSELRYNYDLNQYLSDSKYEIKRTLLGEKEFYEGGEADYIRQTSWFVEKSYIGPTYLEYFILPKISIESNAPVRHFCYIASGNKIVCLFEFKNIYELGRCAVTSNNSIELEYSGKETVQTQKLVFKTEPIAVRYSLDEKDWKVFWSDLGSLKKMSPQSWHYWTWNEWTYMVKGHVWMGTLEFHYNDWNSPPGSDTYYHVTYDGDEDMRKIPYDLPFEMDILNNIELPKGIVEILAKHRI